MKLKHILLLIILATISLSCIENNIEPIKTSANYKTETLYKSARVATDSTPLKILTVGLGQSQWVYYTNSAMNGEIAHGVHGWDQKNKNWVDSLSYKQIQTGAALNTLKHSPMIVIANKLKVLRPNDDLYFMVVAQAGTNLYEHWNPDRNDIYSRFRQAVNAINDAIAAGGPFDEINIIWVQGESDMQETYANGYYPRQKQLFDSLKTLYNVNKFLDYKVYTNSPTLSIVNSAKYDIEALRNDTKVIAIPVIYIGLTINKTYPSISEVHMTKLGVRIFADSCVNHLK